MVDKKSNFLGLWPAKMVKRFNDFTSPRLPIAKPFFHSHNIYRPFTQRFTFVQTQMYIFRCQKSEKWKIFQAGAVLKDMLFNTAVQNTSSVKYCILWWLHLFYLNVWRLVTQYTFFLKENHFFCLILDFLNIMLVIRLIFS